MEREFEPQPLNVSPGLQPDHFDEAHERPAPRIHPAFLVLFMLMPWVWVYLGLYVLGDYRLTIAMYELLGCALPVVIFGGHRIPMFPLRCSPWWLLGMAAILGAMIVLVYLASNGFGMDWQFFAAQASRSRLVVNGPFWLFAAVIGLVNPFLEEAFWRGLIYRGWKVRLGEAKARWVSAFFFGAWHWLVLHHFCNPVWAVVLTLLVMVGGVLFCMLYERTKTLGASVLFHGLGADFPMIFVVFDAVMRHLK